MSERCCSSCPVKVLLAALRRQAFKWNVRLVKTGPPRIPKLKAALKDRELPAIRRHLITEFIAIRVISLGG
jgi:hypothetical protein